MRERPPLELKNTYSWSPLNERSVSRTSLSGSIKGTWCSLPIFMRYAGMVQRSSFRTHSSQRAGVSPAHYKQKTSRLEERCNTAGDLLNPRVTRFSRKMDLLWRLLSQEASRKSSATSVASDQMGRARRKSR